MAKPSNKANEGKKAKIASRSRESLSPQEIRGTFGTRPEDVVRQLPGGVVIAKTQDGVYYRTSNFFVGSVFADPNRYGRPSARLSPEEIATLFASPAGAAE
jgi:hypothetical protein